MLVYSVLVREYRSLREAVESLRKLLDDSIGIRQSVHVVHEGSSSSFRKQDTVQNLGTRGSYTSVVGDGMGDNDHRPFITSSRRGRKHSSARPTDGGTDAAIRQSAPVVHKGSAGSLHKHDRCIRSPDA